ncbi:MAG: peptidoglycan D,D-transpeptidase FtsI family protein, partial [Calditrichia bacterium]
MSGKIKKHNRNYHMADSWQGKIKVRLIALVILLTLGFSVVLMKVIFVQVVHHEKYLKIREKISKREQGIPARRGSILDRNGNTLAEDQVYFSMVVMPKYFKNNKSALRKISKIANLSYSDISAKIKGAGRFVNIGNRIFSTTAEKLKALKLKGLILEKKYNRYYGYGTDAAHVVGFCDFENRPCYGLELEYDEFLRGIPGKGVFLRDNKGWRIPDLDYPSFPSIDGSDVITTIDITYQSVLEDELESTVTTHKAEKGMAVLMNVNTGEILGMANYPHFDPNHFNDYPVKNFKNYAVSDQYEPGYTFKIIALAIVLEQLGMDLDNTRVFCENGRYALFRNVIHDHKKFADLTVREIFEHSSNIGIVKLARQFSAPQFYRYARDFGFGTYSGIDLPAEAAGVLHKPAEFGKTSLSYMSIGYEVAATPLQIAAAYAAIANGGKLMQPYIVQKVVDRNGRILKKKKPRIIRQVIQPETAAEMVSTLKGVVENGTGRNARIDGLSIAGKTGTARKIENGRYVSKYISSFVGFFPVENPQFVLLVVVDEPVGAYYGSQVAAPAFREIARRIIGLPSNLQNNP